MTDEKFLFVTDVRDKKIVARSSRNRRTHTGKGGAVKFPSDYLSKKELKAMNGEVKSYRMNEPMTWDEFKAMPDDLRTSYIVALRTKFNVPDVQIANMFKVSGCTVSLEMKKLGLNVGRNSRGKDTRWDKEGFLAWRNAVSKAVQPDEPVEATPEAAEQPVVKTLEAERQTASLEDIAEPAPVPEIKTLPVREEKAKTIPCSGNMAFIGAAEAALNTVAVLLGGANVRISITWEVCPKEAGVGNG